MKVLDKLLDAIRLNDDYDDEDEFFDDEIDEIDDPKPKKRFFSKLDDDDFDDEDDFDFVEKKPFTVKKTATVPVKQPAKQSSKITPMRKKTSGTSMEVCILKPSSMEDTREIADTLIAHSTVVLNLEGIDVEVAQRIIDFSSGACYSIDGNLQKISSYIFILTPDNVEVSGDFQEILSGAFDLPSMRTEF